MFGFPFSIPQYYQKQEGTKKQEVSAGSGFIINTNGYIITNKHVVSDTKAEYTVLLNDGSKYAAKIIAKDPLEDFALIKIEKTGLTPLKLGNSDNLSLGQTAIAIGNSLGEFQNTVSVGVVSGLHRSITAQDENNTSVTLNDLIQTDAAINPGNSGGPLLNLNGEVIGINVAMEASAQNIGFAIPISKIKGIINQAISSGKISVPFLGIRYSAIDKDLMEEKKLSVDYGALIDPGNSKESAIVKDSPADKAGLKEKDIILSVNKIKITTKNPLSSVVRRFNVGDTVQLEVLREGKTININLILGSRDSN
jgi:serine protease Do